MLQNITYLVGAVLDGCDGIIGAVRGFYCDDRDWVVRYALIETDNGKERRHVCIPSAVLTADDWRSGVVRTGLSQEHVKGGPAINVMAPISRHQELKVIQYYELPVYWRIAARRADPGTGTAIKNPELHAIRDIVGCSVEAHDGTIGSIDDLLVDDLSWEIPYAVVKMESRPRERAVLVPLRWFAQINWEARAARIELPRRIVTQSPAYDPSVPVAPVLEERVSNYYGTPLYGRR